jgi:hypothetical protein
VLRISIDGGDSSSSTGAKALLHRAGFKPLTSNPQCWAQCSRAVIPVASVLPGVDVLEYFRVAFAPTAAAAAATTNIGNDDDDDDDDDCVVSLSVSSQPHTARGRRHFRDMKQVMLAAFAASSSASTLPHAEYSALMCPASVGARLPQLRDAMQRAGVSSALVERMRWNASGHFYWLAEHATAAGSEQQRVTIVHLLACAGTSAVSAISTVVFVPSQHDLSVWEAGAGSLSNFVSLRRSSSSSSNNNNSNNSSKTIAASASTGTTAAAATEPSRKRKQQSAAATATASTTAAAASSSAQGVVAETDDDGDSVMQRPRKKQRIGASGSSSTTTTT